MAIVTIFLFIYLMTRNQDFLFVNRNNDNWCRRFFTDVSNQIVASRFGATVYNAVTFIWQSTSRAYPDQSLSLSHFCTCPASTNSKSTFVYCSLNITSCDAIRLKACPLVQYHQLRSLELYPMMPSEKNIFHKVVWRCQWLCDLF